MLTANKRKLTETFDYVHNVMRIPHHLIVKFPQVIQAAAVWESPIPHLQMPSRGRALPGRTSTTSDEKKRDESVTLWFLPPPCLAC